VGGGVGGGGGVGWVVFVGGVDGWCGANRQPTPACYFPLQDAAMYGLMPFMVEEVRGGKLSNVVHVLCDWTACVGLPAFGGVQGHARFSHCGFLLLFV
jgi:hypothetical protein